MKKFASKTFAILLVMLVLVSSFASAYAAGAGINFNADSKITVHLKDASTQDYVPGAGFTAYKVLNLVEDTTNSGDGTFTIANGFTIPETYKDGNTDKDMFTAIGKATKTGELYNSTDALENLISDLEAQVTSKNITGTALNEVSNGKFELDCKGNLGIYLIKMTKIPTDYTTRSVTTFMVSVPEWDSEAKAWNYNIDAYPKVSKNGTLNKVIGETIEGGVEKDSFAIGAKVPFTVEAKVPHYGYIEPMSAGILKTTDLAGKLEEGKTLDDYLKFQFIDTMTDGLTFNNDVKVVVGTTTLTKDTDYTVVTTTGENNSTVVTIKFKWTSATGVVAHQGETITLNYTATLDKDADIVNLETNTVSHTYTQRWTEVKNEDGTVTPEVTVEDEETLTDKTSVYTYAMHIDKTFEGNAKTSGCEAVTFELQDKDGKAINVTGANGKYTVGGTSAVITLTADGKVDVTGLDEGTYFLVEKTTIDGYNILTTPIQIEVQANTDKSAVNAYYYGENNTTTQLKNTGSYKFNVTVNNVKKQFTLPTTGGDGLLIFTIAGGILMAAAIILFTTLRKKSTSK